MATHVPACARRAGALWIKGNPDDYQRDSSRFIVSSPEAEALVLDAEGWQTADRQHALWQSAKAR
jgi:hypothetical protein